MSQPLDIIIVERLGSLKIHSIKDFKVEELYKKCGFKKADGFDKQTEWELKYDGNKYTVQVYAKTDGRANSENKYDFPPPIDTKLFFGSCALVGLVKNDDGNKVYANLTIPMWTKMYEKLFGGFEDLAATAKEDEEEEDELANVPKEKKTKDGYLKDGFVVDSSDSESVEYSESSEFEDDDSENDSGDYETEEEDELEVEDVGSELSEESYDYDDRDVAKN
jgi:hypothetical protein